MPMPRWVDEYDRAAAAAAAAQPAAQPAARAAAPARAAAGVHECDDDR